MLAFLRLGTRMNCRSGWRFILKPKVEVTEEKEVMQVKGKLKRERESPMKL